LRQSETEALQASQERWLLECLQRNAGSYYGRQYGFEKIGSAEAYRKQVPLVDYETLSPLIERIAKGETDLLFRGSPIAFEITGGSSGGGKLIPYTQESFADFRRAILPWFGHIAERYGVTGAAAYWSISPALRLPNFTKSGIRIGVTDAAYLGEETGAAFADAAVVPSWVGELTDVGQWQLATLYWLTRCEELELVSVWSPTFLMMLMELLEERHRELLKLLHYGGTIAGHELQPDAEAGRRFERYLETRESAELWPRLKLISCWQDASSRPFYERLQQRLPHSEFQPKGLICTEGVVTMPDGEGSPLLSPESGFYEFLDVDGKAYLADELTAGEAYEVVMTTNGGLYRYRSGDLVRCEGRKKGIPVLRFIGRSGIVSDMVGEKLNEAFVRQALEGVGGFAMLMAVQTGRPHYLLLTDSTDGAALAEEVEAKLRANPQYAYAREIGQLAELETALLEEAMRHYIDYKTALGSRIGDIKIPALQTDEAWLKRVKGVRR